MAAKPDYDVVVIGSGSAGFAAARTAAALGARTAVVEAGPQIAGLCILRGCMPSKALLASANRMHAIRHARELGIDAAAGRPNLGRILARKRALVAEFAKYREHQLRTGDFEFIRGRARFLDAHTVVLPNGRRVTGKNFIVCTGSRVSKIEFEGLEETGFIDSDAALELSRLPRSIAVLGGGAVALELGQYFSRLGSRVTILQRSEHLLTCVDADLAECVRESFEAEGLGVLTGTKLLRFEKKGAKKSILFLHSGRKRRLVVDEIFYALGRVPNTDGMGLEEIGVKLQRGIICVDATMRSSVPNVFAAGDVNGEHEIVHIAVQEGELAARNAVLGRKEKWDGRAKAFAIFTEPQIAAVGLSEGELESKKYLAAKYPFADHGKSMVLGETRGFVKVIADPRGKILGAQVVGPEGSDLIHELIALVHLKATVFDLATLPHYHPTLSEIWTYPAEEIVGKLRRRP